MKLTPEISEFSYGFAATRELLTLNGWLTTGAPTFPTQYEEGKKGGYDVKIPVVGGPVFLQFKRSDCLIRGTAKESPPLQNPYYRMHLHAKKHSRQHALLLDLEAKHQDVFYLAPRFHRAIELDDAYVNSKVIERSSAVPPSWVGPLPDDFSHYIAIAHDDSRRLFCSDEHRDIDTAPMWGLLSRRRQIGARRVDAPLDAYCLELGNELVDLFFDGPRFPLHRKLRDRALAAKDRHPPLEYAREVSQTLFGCELLFWTAE